MLDTKDIHSGGTPVVDILLESIFEHSSARQIYGYIKEKLTAQGYRVTLVDRLRLGEGMEKTYHLLISHGVVSAEQRARIPLAFGGRMEDRATLLQLAQTRSDLSMMEWALCSSEAELRQLFGAWETDLIILKRSGTAKATGVTLVTPSDLDLVAWKPTQDIFCKEVDPKDGRIFKLEAFNGEITIGWMAEMKPIRNLLAGMDRTAWKAGLGERRLFEFGEDLKASVARFSRYLTSQGYGYVSFDFMMDPAGQFRLIEFNTEFVATWWTANFRFVQERYAVGIGKLLPEVSPTVARSS
jgi:hypothetical protein